MPGRRLPLPKLCGLETFHDKADRPTEDLLMSARLSGTPSPRLDCEKIGEGRWTKRDFV
jgi:hypothetical protein